MNVLSLTIPRAASLHQRSRVAGKNHHITILSTTLLRFFSGKAAARLPILVCLLGLFLLLPLARDAAAAPASERPKEGESFVQRRAFRGLVRRDMAEHAASVAAEVAAYDQAVRILAKDPDVRFALDSGKIGKTGPLSLDGLARMVFSTRVTAIGVEGFPPDMRAVVYVRLELPASLRASVVEALRRHDLLELYGRVHAALRGLSERYDRLAEPLLPLRPIEDGGKEALFTLQSVVNEMTALERFLKLIRNYDQRWDNPQKVREELLRAETLAPENPLILTGLSEAFLQLDRPVAALDYVGRALRSAPDYARAHDIKGAALLRQRLPALAAESFGRAIAIAPDNPVYYVHRASAWLVLEEEAAMCSDFKRACGLEDCEGLRWAKGAGRCLTD